MKNALLKVREFKEIMTPTEKEIADYILENSSLICNMTIREFAENTFSSPSSIVRFCKKIGFEGFNDFQKSVLYDIASQNKKEENASLSLKANEDIGSIINKVSRGNIKIIEESKKLIDEDTIAHCASLLSSARKILLFGIGSSYYVAKDLYMKLLRLNMPVYSDEDYHTQLMRARNSSSDDVAFIFSYSGQTKEMIDCINLLKKNGATVVSVTRYTPSTISKLSDYNLYVASGEPVLKKENLASKVAMLNLVDMLYTIYIVSYYEGTFNTLLKTHLDKGEENYGLI
ncbi:MAG: MurR/RpiR family transcriptional regulator [Erysipelotrichaceae bacterium]